MSPGSESGLLQFLTAAASLVLVCAGLLLLTSTAPWAPHQTVENEVPTPTAAHNAASASVPIDVVSPRAASATVQARTTPSSDAAMSGEHAEVAEAEPAAPEPMQHPTPEPSSPQGEGALATSDVPQVPATDPAEAEAIAAESMVVADANANPETAVETDAVPETAAIGEPDMVVAGKTTTAASDQIGEPLAALPPKAIASETISEDGGDVADVSAAAPTASPGNANGMNQPARSETAASVPLPLPPLPKRKPKAEAPTSTETARAAPSPARSSRPEAPKQDQARPAVAQQAPAQPGTGAGRWLAMALAPADKPAPAQPTARLGGAAYARKVWVALARHKPRAGKNGSATVVFSIGATGTLASVTIGTSSGNARIDQLALATVHTAAPFPPPPSGAASFSIRIDFQ